ncbi:hypothetical protein Tco_1267987, partial [Tanacetum coccineum]
MSRLIRRGTRAQQEYSAQSISLTSSASILGPGPTQETLLPNAFSTMTLDDPTWNTDT